MGLNYPRDVTVPVCKHITALDDVEVICCGTGWCTDCWEDHDIAKHEFPIVPEDEE